MISEYSNISAYFCKIVIGSFISTGMDNWVKSFPTFFRTRESRLGGSFTLGSMSQSLSTGSKGKGYKSFVWEPFSIEDFSPEYGGNASPESEILSESESEEAAEACISSVDSSSETDLPNGFSSFMKTTPAPSLVISSFASKNSSEKMDVESGSKRERTSESFEFKLKSFFSMFSLEAEGSSFNKL